MSSRLPRSNIACAQNANKRRDDLPKIAERNSAILSQDRSANSRLLLDHDKQELPSSSVVDKIHFAVWSNVLFWLYLVLVLSGAHTRAQRSERLSTSTVNFLIQNLLLGN